MTYTILGARCANEDGSAAIIETKEVGQVLISAQDTPDLWQAMLDWGLPVPYEAPQNPFPEITQRQLLLWLLGQGRTEADVLTVIDNLPDTEREQARIEFLKADRYQRNHALIERLGPALGFTPDQMDEGWRQASAL